VALALPVVLALVLGTVAGGRPSRLAELHLRAWWLLLAAVGVQLVAFPVGVLPWTTAPRVASALWVASYALLVVVAVLNARVPGVAIVAVGMALNIAAVLANGGTMPVLPRAMLAAGDHYATFANSTAAAHPNLPWLVDRWAAPGWIPFANVFSVGDLVIAAGTMVLVLAAMGVGAPLLAPRPSRG
jgi:hypothetical protein